MAEKQTHRYAVTLYEDGWRSSTERTTTVEAFTAAQARTAAKRKAAGPDGKPSDWIVTATVRSRF